MSRKLAVVMIAIAAAVVFAASMSVAGDPPDSITIQKSGERQPPVTFSHKLHAELVDCFVCHHEAKAKEEIKRCFECHGVDPGIMDIKDAFHGQCIDCHKKEAKGPTRCRECHVK